MASQEIPSGDGVKNISIPRSDAYEKIATTLQILYQASFKFSPSLCLKLRTSLSGVLTMIGELAMRAKKMI